MRWDRVEWWCAALYAVASVGLSVVLFDQRAEVWRYEHARALDGAGLYLFAMAPALVACAAVSAQRRQTALRGIDVALPDRTLAGRSAALRMVLWAFAVHGVIVLGALAVSLRVDAFATLSLVPLVRPALLIVAAATLGATLGSRTSSPLVPALIGLVSFLLASMSEVGLRELLVVGGGYFDYGFRAWDLSAFVPLAGLAAAGTLLCLPRPPRAWLRRAGALGAGVLLAVAVVLTTTQPPATHALPASPHCLVAEITVCAPENYLDAAAAVSGVLTALQGRQPEIVDLRFPGRRVTLVGPEGRAAVDEVAYESSMSVVPGAVARTVIEAVVTPASCDPQTEPMPNLVARATVAGWLQRQVDADLDGSYPSDLVARLEGLRDGERRAVVDALLDGLASCRQVDLSRLDPDALYG